jgi:SAM-dependent methyltransferase
MHSRVYQEFERIVSARKVAGSVLEVGALPRQDSLLCMDPLRATTERIGINLDGPYDYNGFKIVKGNANHMTCFEDGRFDVVLCNALLEHDKYFWKTTGEIKRVTKPGGLVVIGAPGYTNFPGEQRIKWLFKRVPGLRDLGLFTAATVTFEIHNFPGDYYRFSPQAFREVFFDGMDAIEVRTIMQPPRIIGAGIKR